MAGIWKFYLRRSLKILPLYWAVLTAMVILLPLPRDRTAGFLQEFLCLGNYGDAVFGQRVMFWGWSVAIEQHFYLAAPFLVALLFRFSSHRARIVFLIVLWASGFVSRLVTSRIAIEANDYSFLSSGGVFIRTHTRYDIIVAGVLVAYLQFYFKDAVVNFLERRGTRPILTAIIVFLVYLLSARPDWAGGNSPLFLIFAWGTTTTVMFVPLLLMVINGRGGLVRFLSAGIFRKIATLTYGVYLVHTPICTALLPLARHALLRLNTPLPWVWLTLLAITILISLMVAYVFHIIVEKPVFRIRG